MLITNKRIWSVRKRITLQHSFEGYLNSCTTSNVFLEVQIVMNIPYNFKDFGKNITKSPKIITTLDWLTLK